MVPVLGMIGAGLSLFGGFNQAAAIRRATEERLRQMRLQQAQAESQFVARAGATGVEMTSGTLQTSLDELKTEWQRRIEAVKYSAAEAQGNTIMAAAGSAFSSFGQNLYKASQLEGAIGSDPLAPAFDGMPSTTPPLAATPEFDWVR